MFIKKCRECTVVNTDVTLTTPRSGKFLSCSIHYFTFSFSYLIFLLLTYKYFHNITPYHVSSHNHFFRCNQNDSVKIPCFKPETELIRLSESVLPRVSYWKAKAFLPRSLAAVIAHFNTLNGPLELIVGNKRSPFYCWWRLQGYPLINPDWDVLKWGGF